jgi:hypothetical protein
MRDEEVIAKFKANASAVMPASQQDRVVEATWSLGEKEMPISEYMKLLIV